ncbi:MAG: hypothetical protein ACRDDH_11905 [Cetobacterium sp.]|uniref:hypothetical protein n=1 Tax=Cetobacterium sp. TaxID=2071632 RepID=UPI003EE5E7D6
MIKTIHGLKIISPMGKSACGKTSFCLDLKERFGDIIHIVKSKTTRAERVEDPNDKESHVFCTEDDFNPDTTIAVYHSPKGYISWTDESCFEKDKINIYTIDPVAFRDEMNPYCKDNGIELIGFYLGVSEAVRKRRHVQREGNLKDYSREDHLALHHLDKIKNVVVIDAGGTRKATLVQVEDLMEGLIDEMCNNNRK